MEKKYRFLLVSFACLAILCMGKVLYLQTFQKSSLSAKAERQRANPVPIDAKRGDIISSDGSVLATSVPTYNVYSDTRYIKDVEAAAKIVSEFFEMDYKEVLDKINSRYYVELVKGVTKDKIDEFSKIRPRGVSFYETTTRVYPNNYVMGNLLGFIGAEGNGLSGLELSLNSYLAGTDGVNNSERDKNGNAISFNQKDVVDPINGGNTTLTVNYDIQYQMQKEIQAAVEQHGAKKGFAISMNPKDGSILGIAEYPTMDPNNYKDFDQSLYKSSALSMTYEPGSTFKPVTVAIAEATGHVDIVNEKFPDGGSYYVGKHRIGNWGKKAFGIQTAREILMNSSNVGTVQIAFRVPPNEYYEYLKKFGFGTKTGIELPGEQNSIMFSKEQLEKDINRATNSFGQGIAVTPLQLMKSWAAMVNGGYAINPHILKEVADEHGNKVYSNTEKIQNVEQILPTSTSDKVKTMLQAVVDGGTGKKGRIAGYSVGGKTGTAQKVENGRYSQTDYIVSFLGFAPVENPEVMTLVVLDSPSNGKASGGGMCAPTFKNITEYALSRLGIKPNFGESLVSDDSNNNMDEYSEGDVVEEVVGSEISVADYRYRLKSYVTKNAPPIPYEFEGDGDLVIDQAYVPDGETTKIVFRTDTVVKEDYIIMPDLTGMVYNDFIDIFAMHSDKLILNGVRTSPVTVQDYNKGENVDIKTNKITLWTE